MNRILNTIRQVVRLIGLCCAIAVTYSCSQDLDIQTYQGRLPIRDTPHRDNSPETRRTLLLYSAGYHNLSSDLSDDIKDLCDGYLPGGERYDDQIFIFTHQTASKYDYATPTNAYLLKVYRDHSRRRVIDTLVTYPIGTVSASADTFAQVVEYVDKNFPSKELGVIFSSHATGWLPIDYYNKNTLFAKYAPRRQPLAQRQDVPMTKSIGAEFSGSYRNALEIDLKEFAAKIKTHIDYMIFDACLMGGIEVAYELKDICDKILFSPTEVISWGMDYSSIGSRLFSGPESDVRGIAEDYFNYYNSLSGDYRSATVSVIDCRKLEELARVCSDIFKNHRYDLMRINPADVQRLNRKPWFYDFKDILDHLNLSQEENIALDKALNDCIIYKAATEKFIDIEINAYSGLSMYIERAGNQFLNSYYSDLKWNRATKYIL